MATTTTRWGICGTGKISQDFCQCLLSLPSSDHQIVAVAAREDGDKASRFASRFNISTSFGSYQELAQLPGVDIIYVGTIQPLHVETCLIYVNAGKNVLCEKPVALTLQGCQKVLAAAKEKGVFFIEGWWSRFFPVYKFIQEDVLAKGVLGDIKLLEASFCGPKLTPERINKWKPGGGAYTDIGAYGVQAAALFFKEKPSVVKVEAAFTDTGRDKAGVILMKFPGDKLASVNYCMETQATNNALTVRGTKGTLVIPEQFWSPKCVYVNGKLHEFELPSVNFDVNSLNYPGSEGLLYEIHCVRECLLKGLLECPIVPHKESELISAMSHEILIQLGYNYNSM